MGYRKTSELVVKTRLCNECRAPIVGLTDRGLTVWLDVTPCTFEVEQLFHKAGRRVYLVQPRAKRTYWFDWRSPYSASAPPSRGIVLAEHPHQSPGKTKVSDPPWVLDTMTELAPVDESEVLF
jgi:hypothetical protein